MDAIFTHRNAASSCWTGRSNYVIVISVDFDNGSDSIGRFEGGIIGRSEPPNDSRSISVTSLGLPLIVGVTLIWSSVTSFYVVTDEPSLGRSISFEPLIDRLVRITDDPA